MAEHTLGSVGRRALGESLQAVKLDKPLSVLIAFGVPGLVGLTTWWRTGEAAMTGFFALGAVAALFAAIFLGKMISVPLAVAAESDARRNAAEDALGARVAVLEALQAEKRDPDAIYQYGMIVAKVMHPTLVRQQGIIHFAALVDAQHLNLDGEFEYREFVLQKLHSQGENIAFMGNLQNRTIPEVTARIIRSRC